MVIAEFSLKDTYLMHIPHILPEVCNLYHPYSWDGLSCVLFRAILPQKTRNLALAWFENLVQWDTITRSFPFSQLEVLRNTGWLSEKCHLQIIDYMNLFAHLLATKLLKYHFIICRSPIPNCWGRQYVNRCWYEQTFSLSVVESRVCLNSEGHWNLIMW